MVKKTILNNSIKVVSNVFQKNKIIHWASSNFEAEIKYSDPPRFLMVEDSVIGRISLIDTLKRHKCKFILDIAATGIDAVSKHKFYLNNGYIDLIRFIYDFIFMDINLPDMYGSDATMIMRNFEKEFKNVHTNILVVTVENKNQYEHVDLFDNYCN